MALAFREKYVLSLVFQHCHGRICPFRAKQTENVTFGFVKLRTGDIPRPGKIDRDDLPNAAGTRAHDRDMRSKRQSLVDSMRHENDGASMFLPDAHQFVL